MPVSRVADLTSRTDAPTVMESAPRSTTRPEERTFADGDRIVGRYVVESLLGQGGFGQVYKVRDEYADGRPVALKLTRLHDAGSRALDTLKSEFALLATLSHPNLAAVHDFGRVGNDIAYFTQTLVRGIPLNQATLRPDDPEALLYFTQLCRALEYLHARGILHRDIKPSNILVDFESRVLTLLDFGISRALGAADERLLVGTWAYMPPEAITGGPVDARSDLYSLGVTLYRQLMGRVPFEGAASEVLEAHLSRIPEPLPPARVKPEVARVVERLLCKEPGARYASAREVLHALAQANQVALPAEPSAELASYVLSGRFVGHEKVFETLVERCFDEDPAASALLVVGEGGSGKSRLLREVRQRVQLAWRTWIQVQVRSSWVAKNVLHGIARSVIDDEVRKLLDDDDRLELARALPELRRRREQITVPVDPERARVARIEALARALALRFAAAPGVLVVEDVHWADRDTLALLIQLVRSARRARVRCLFVFASRPGEIADEVARELEASVMGCDALEPLASVRLVESMFGRADLLEGTELGKSLGRSAQTAQYVQESLRLALDSSVVVRREGEWELVKSIPALPLPEVLARRVGHLTERGQELALAVAVLGGEASASDGAVVAGKPPELAGAALRDLVRAGILEERYDAGGRAVYAMHDRFRDVVLDIAPEKALVGAHRFAGRLLRSAAEGDFRMLLDAAEHFARARSFRLAIRAAEEAARASEKAGRPDQAVTASAAQIRWLREIGPVPVSAWLRRFDLCVLAGMREASDLAMSELVALHDRATEAERIAVAVRRARLALERGEPEAARATAESVLKSATSTDDPRLLSELYWVMARAEEVYGQLDRAFSHFERAAGFAERAGDAPLEARAWLGASLAAVFLGNARQSGALAERSLAAARSTSDRFAMAEALRGIGNSARESGDIQRALRMYRRAVRAAREGGSPESEAKALNNLGTVCHWVALIPEAISALERSLFLKERLGMNASAMLTRNNLGGLYLSLGRFDEAQAEFKRVIEVMGEKEPMVTALAHSNFGDLCVLRGELDTAVALYRAAHRMNEARSNAMADSHALPGLARALLMRDRPGDLDEAGRVLEVMGKLHEASDLAETKCRYLVGSAVLLDRVGDREKALSQVRRALEVEVEQRQHFSDPFGTVLEAQWIEAILLGRLERITPSRRAAMRTRQELLRYAKQAGDENSAKVFLESNPLHRAIVSGRLDTRPGWTWFADG